MGCSVLNKYSWDDGADIHVSFSFHLKWSAQRLARHAFFWSSSYGLASSVPSLLPSVNAAEATVLPSAPEWNLPPP